MKISNLKKYLFHVKPDNSFRVKNLYLPLILKQNRLFETLYQKYGLYTLPDGG